MPWKIRQALGQRLRPIFQLINYPHEFILYPRVLPTIDYHKTMEKHIYYERTGRAGNLVTTIGPPSEGKKWKLEYGKIILTTI